MIYYKISLKTFHLIEIYSNYMSIIFLEWIYYTLFASRMLIIFKSKVYIGLYVCSLLVLTLSLSESLEDQGNGIHLL